MTASDETDEQRREPGASRATPTPPPPEAFAAPAVMGGSAAAADHRLPGAAGGGGSDDDGGNSGSEEAEGGGGTNPFAESPDRSAAEGGIGGGRIQHSAHDLSPRWGAAATVEDAALASSAPAFPLVTDQPGHFPAPQAAAGFSAGIRMLPPPPHHHGAFGPTLYARPEDAASHLTVSDPIQNTEGVAGNKKYIAYRVEVHPHNRGADGPPALGAHSTAGMQRSAVQRRYRDFHWLSTQLRRERPGSIVPPLPEKQAVGRCDPEFVEERRAGLEKFLRRCAVHPELVGVECLSVFLGGDDATFVAAKNKKQPGGGEHQSSRHDAAPDNTTNLAPAGGGIAPSAAGAAAAGVTPKKKNKLKNWFQETTTALSRDLVQSPDDQLFDEILRYVDELEKATKKCHHEAERLVKKRREENGLYIDLGKALSQLGAAEAEPLGRPAAVVGDASSSALAPLCSDAAEAELHKFLEPLADHLRTLGSVRSALHKRQDKRLTYSTALHTVAAKNAGVNKLRGTTNPNNAGAQMKVYDADLSLSRARAAAETARLDYEAVSGRLLREVDRFKCEGARSIRATLAEFASVQSEFHRRMERAWGELVPRLGEIDLDSSSGMVPPPSGAAGVGAGAAVGTLSTTNGGMAPPPLHGAAMMPPHAYRSAAAALAPPPPPAQAQAQGIPVVEPNHPAAAQAQQGMVGGVQYRDTAGIDWST